MQWQMSLFHKRVNRAISFILSYSLVDFAFQLPFFQLISIALSQAVQQKTASVSLIRVLSCEQGWVYSTH